VTNTVLYRGSEATEFATVFFGRLRCDDGRFVYCNAGHTTTGLIRADGSVERLPSNSQLVGALAKARFTDARTELLPGDQLFMYTDGLIEARRGPEFFGEERVFEILERLGAVSPEEVVRTMLEEVEAFTGGDLFDDLAVLAVKRPESRS
jgi:serine phosphatase RsbU (regulator of sigma subunit)